MRLIRRRTAPNWWRVRECVAGGACGVQGGTLRGGTGESAIAAHRSQWRHFPGRERTRAHSRISRNDQRRQAGTDADFRQRPEAAVWDCVLSAGARSTVDLYRQYQRSDSLPLSQWRFEGEWRRRSTSPTCPRGRALDARGRVFSGWQENVCGRGLGLE